MGNSNILLLKLLVKNSNEEMLEREEIEEIKRLLTNIEKQQIKYCKQQKLIKQYEDRLEKVKGMYSHGRTNFENEKNNKVIEYWTNQLEEVKNGRKW